MSDKKRKLDEASNGDKQKNSGAPPPKKDKLLQESNNQSKFYDEKIRELKEEESEVNDGSHPEVVEAIAEFKESRDRKLHEARVFRDLRIAEMNQMYEYQVKAANDIFETSKKDFENKLIAEIDEAIKRYADLKEGVADDMRMTSSRKLRSKTKGNEISADGLPLEGTRRRTKNSSSESLNFFVDENEILRDMKKIHKDWKKMAEKFLESDELCNINVKVERGKLFVNEEILEKDTPVIIKTEMMKDELYGDISSFNKNEVFVTLDDNTKSVILLDHIRSGRCTVVRNNEA